MLRIHALTGVSVIAMALALLAPAANAQSGQNLLPPVVVQAPREPPPRAVRKPSERAVAVRRNQPKPATAPAPPAPAVSANIDGGGVNASFGTPPAVVRFQLPQQSFSITAKQIDETINLKDPEDAIIHAEPVCP